MFVISRIDYHIYRKLYGWAYWGSVALLALVPMIGIEVNGARRWIEIGSMQLQPSEIAKIGLIIAAAGYLANNKDKLGSLWHGFLKPFIYLMLPIGILVVFQNHLSVSIVIAIITSVMMVVAGTRLIYFVVFGGIGSAAGIVGMFIMAQKTGQGSFRWDRVMAFLDPWADAKGDGWQITQSLYAIGSGGLFGAGLGQSKQKYLYLPFPHNDFIFSVLAEELGFVGCTVVIILFAIFIWRGVLTAIKAPDTFGSFLAIGITTLVGIQAIINIAVVTNSMPVTGMPLPFFSYGGTALLILLCSMGVLLNISRQTKKI